jgi:hypothetical protein
MVAEAAARLQSQSSDADEVNRAVARRLLEDHL